LKSLPPYPTEKSFDLAAAEVIGLELVPWGFSRFVSHSDFAYISFGTIKANYQTGFAYDRDAFITNQSSHPYHGSLFFNSARTNGFTFWESVPFAMFGSLLWELHMENTPPSINDLVNTTLGGSTRGEIQYRVSKMILDNTKSGSERFWREAAALVVNPISGFNRIVKGEMWRDFQNPDDRFPSRFYLELDGMYRHRAGSAPAGVDTDQGGVSMLLRYGDPFDAGPRQPFEYFDFAIDLVQPAATLVTRIESRGLLTSWDLCECGPVQQRLGIFLHFNFFNNEPTVYGSQALSVDHLMRIPLGNETDLRTEIGVTALPLAALQVDYNKIGLVTGVGRSYDYGPGGGAQAKALVQRRDMDLLSLSYQVLWQSPSNGTAKSSRVQTLDAEGRLPLSKSLAVGAGWTWGERLSTYDVLPTVDVTGTSWRAFAAWNFRETYGASGRGPEPSVVSSATSDVQGRWEIGALGGGFFGSRVLKSPLLNVMTATAPVFGVRVGYGVTRVFSLEASWSHANSKLEPQIPDTSQPAGPTSPLTVNSYELDGLFGFGSKTLRGHVGFGGGVMNLDPNVPSLNGSGATLAFAANIAVGGKLFLSDNVAVRVDGRYRWRIGDNRLGTILCDSLGCQPFDTNFYSSVELTGGLTYRF
ncbi:MAG: DUF3943 domain-containing protein, partial [Thermoanaerobaculia bacterium]